MGKKEQDLSFDNYRGVLVEGICPHRQREKVGIVAFEVAYIVHPLESQIFIHPDQVPFQVVEIAVRER